MTTPPFLSPTMCCLRPAVPGAPTMSVVGPSADNKQHQAAEVFEVDFDGVREAFDGSSSRIAASDGRGAGGGAVNVRSVAGAGAAALAPLMLGAAEASAKGGEFGIIEGRTASFFHPIVMVRNEGKKSTTAVRVAAFGVVLRRVLGWNGRWGRVKGRGDHCTRGQGGGDAVSRRRAILATIEL